MERYGNGYALILLDDGFISLREGWRRSPLDWDIFFQITQQLADILHYLHRQQIVHKDIKPANILIHPTTHQLKLIDFSIASLLPKEQQQFVTPQGIQGTLGYISPEQTGRMNRGVDYRTDFYSLGVTFYELLTGQLPFDHEDPLAIIHAHIAQVPPSLATQCDEQGQPYPEAIAPKQVVAARNSYGGTGFEQVRLAIADAKLLMYS